MPRSRNSRNKGHANNTGFTVMDTIIDSRIRASIEDDVKRYRVHRISQIPSWRILSPNATIKRVQKLQNRVRHRVCHTDPRPDQAKIVDQVTQFHNWHRRTHIDRAGETCWCNGYDSRSTNCTSDSPAISLSYNSGQVTVSR